MEHKKILNLLNEANDSKFVAKNEILSIINPMKNMAKAIKLSVIQEFVNLIFVVTTMLRC